MKAHLHNEAGSRASLAVLYEPRLDQRFFWPQMLFDALLLCWHIPAAHGPPPDIPELLEAGCRICSEQPEQGLPAGTQGVCVGGWVGRGGRGGGTEGYTLPPAVVGMEIRRPQ